GDFLFRQNLYGVAAIGSYDLGGSNLDTQLWLGYLNKRAFFYALDVVYGLDIDQDLNYTLQLSYLGNSVDSALKDRMVAQKMTSAPANLPTGGNADETLIANGNLINLMGTLKGYGFDGSLGGVLYGKKGKFTINRLDDSFLAGGREIFYVKGSNIMNSFGQNTFGYVKAGYTLPSDLRLGVQFVYGSTQAGDRNIGNAEYYGGGGKMEAV
ncbi:major outer membrane protein, partial [Campylobacter sp. MIT 97-5078]